MANVTCIKDTCGVDFAIPDHVQRQGLSLKNRSIYCPNGHSFVYAVTEEEKLRKLVEDMQRTIDGLSSIKRSQEDEIDKLGRTICYWKGIAHRKQRAR